MSEVKIKVYKMRLTKGDHAKMEKNLKEASKVYRWLRAEVASKERGTEPRYSKNEVRKRLSVQWSNIYQTFLEPGEYITIDRLVVLNEMLPEKSLAEILTALAPDYSKEWWELGETEGDLLMAKFKK